MDITSKYAPKDQKTSHKELLLGVPGYSFLDLHEPERLAALHATFLAFLKSRDAALFDAWTAHSEGTTPLVGPAESELLIGVARHQSAFLARLFAIEGAVGARKTSLLDRQIVYKVRDRFVKKVVRRVQLAAGTTPEAVHAHAAKILAAVPGRAVDAEGEERFCSRVFHLLERTADEPYARARSNP